MEFERIDTKTPVLHIYNYASIDYIMDFGQEHEDSGLITTHAHPLHPIKAGREISTEIRGLDDVFALDDLGTGLYTQFIVTYIPCINSCILSDWNKLPLRDIYIPSVAMTVCRMIPYS